MAYSAAQWGMVARLGRSQNVGVFSPGLLYPRAARVIWWPVVTKALGGLNDVLYGLMQRHEGLDWVPQSTQAHRLLRLALLGGLFALTGSVACGAAGLVLVRALALMVYHLLHARRLDRGPWLTRHIPAAWPRLTAPLGLVLGLVSLSSTLPRFFVEPGLGQHELDIYRALTYVMVAGSLVVTALGTPSQSGWTHCSSGA